MNTKHNADEVQLLSLSLDGDARTSSAATKCVYIKFKYLAFVAYFYLLLPIVIFFNTWLRWYFGVVATLCILIGFYVLLRSDYLAHAGQLVLPIRSLLLIALLFLIWNWLAGQGGFFYQTPDHHSRNAVFRDLINFSWPVKYPETGNALVYYLLHWIVPALFGKVFGWIGGNIALLIWTHVGTMISYLLVIYLCKAFTTNSMLIVGLLFITWSGLNTVGMTIMTLFGQGSFALGSAEGWLDDVLGVGAYAYLYAPNDSHLSYAFNQTIAPWIAIPLFLENRKIRTFAFIGLCIYPFAPIPFVGLAALMIGSAGFIGYKMLKGKQYLFLLKEVFSIPNLTAITSIFIIFSIYFGMNTSGQQFGLYTPIHDWDLQRTVVMLLFYLLEFGLYMLLISDEHKRDRLFWLIGASLILIPLLKIGYGRDFCMRASIPALFTLMILVIRYALNLEEKAKSSFARVVLFVIVLTLAAISPILGITSRIMITNQSYTIARVADNIVTFSNKLVPVSNLDPGYENVLVADPDSSFFYKYLARTP